MAPNRSRRPNLAAHVVIDTNALLLPFERRLRVEAELERLLGPFEGHVPSRCLDELDRIAKEESGGRRDRAKMARQYASRFHVIPGEGAPDGAALAAAESLGAYLLTMDRALIRRAHAARVPIIRLKGLSHLVIDRGSGPEPE